MEWVSQTAPLNNLLRTYGNPSNYCNTYNMVVCWTWILALALCLVRVRPTGCLHTSILHRNTEVVRSCPCHHNGGLVLHWICASVCYKHMSCSLRLSSTPIQIYGLLFLSGRNIYHHLWLCLRSIVLPRTYHRCRIEGGWGRLLGLGGGWKHMMTCRSCRLLFLMGGRFCYY